MPRTAVFYLNKHNINIDRKARFRCHYFTCILPITMPNKCCVFGCRGNYNEFNKETVFKIPKDGDERTSWLDALPKRIENNKPYEYLTKSFICARHWPGFPDKTPHKTIAGGAVVPTIPPFHFPGVPDSCIPKQKKVKRSSTFDIEKRQMKALDTIDLIDGFKNIANANKHVNLDNVFIKHMDLKCTFLVFNWYDDKPTFVGYVDVSNQQGTLSDIQVSAYDCYSNKISISHCTLPNNQITRWSQIQEILVTVRNFQNSKIQRFNAAVHLLKDEENENAEDTRTQFLIRQLELTMKKEYNQRDLMFAVTSFPNAQYEFLRNYLILPSSRKIRDLKSGVSPHLLMQSTFENASDQQKVCILLIDEVKVKPSLLYRGHGIFG